MPKTVAQNAKVKENSNTFLGLLKSIFWDSDEIDNDNTYLNKVDKKIEEQLKTSNNSVDAIENKYYSNSGTSNSLRDNIKVDGKNNIVSENYQGKGKETEKTQNTGKEVER